MVLVKRNEFDSRCIILERYISREDLPVYLEIIKEQYEAEGWNYIWDDDELKCRLTVYRGRFECISFLPYFKRVPTRRDWFVW